MDVRKIKSSVTHQEIGGKDFIIDWDVSRRLTPASVLNRAKNGNIACYNFVNRRPDFDEKFPYKLYYGKVGMLGYIVSEDEFEKPNLFNELFNTLFNR